MKYDQTKFTLFEIDEHRGNDWLGTIMALVVGCMIGFLLIFALSIVSQIMV